MGRSGKSLVSKNLNSLLIHEDKYKCASAIALSPYKDILERIHILNSERDWDQFHSPNNLAMNLGVEAGELMEHFR